MSDFTAHLRLTADGKQFVGAIRAADAAFDKLARKTGGAAGQAEKLGGATGRAGKQIDKAGRRAKAAGRDMDGLGRRARGLGGEMQGLAGRVNLVSGAFGALSAGAVVRSLFSSFSDFQSGLAGVAKTTELTADQLDRLGERLQEMSRSPFVATATTELLKMAESAGQLGVNGAANIEKFTRVIAQLGIATADLGGEEAALDLARLIGITGESVANIDRLGAAITFLGNNYKTLERELVDVALRVARGTAQFDVAVQDVLAIAAALKQVGVEAEEGGGVILRTFQALSDAVRAGGQELDEMAAIAGVTAQAFAESFKERPAEAFALFISGLAEIKARGGDVAGTLEEMGLEGIRVVSVIGSLVKGSDDLTKALRDSNKAYEENIALVDEVSKKTKLWENRVTTTGAAITEAGTKGGSAFQKLGLAALGTAEVVADSFSALFDILNTPVTDIPGSTLVADFFEPTFTAIGLGVDAAIEDIDRLMASIAAMARVDVGIDRLASWVEDRGLMGDLEAGINAVPDVLLPRRFTGGGDLTGDTPDPVAADVTGDTTDPAAALIGAQNSETRLKTLRAAATFMSDINRLHREELQLIGLSDGARKVELRTREILAAAQEDKIDLSREEAAGMARAQEAAIKSRTAQAKAAEAARNRGPFLERINQQMAEELRLARLNEKQIRVETLTRDLLAEAQRKNVDLSEEEARSKARGHIDALAQIEAEAQAREDLAARQRKDFEEAARVYTRIWDNAADNIQDALAGSFREVFDEGISGFDDFGDQVVNIMKDVAAQIAAAMIFQPLLGDLAGGFNLFGGGGGAGGAGGAGGGGGLLGSLGTSIAGSAFGKSISSFGIGAKLLGTAATDGAAATSGLIGSGGNLFGLSGLGASAALAGAGLAAAVVLPKLFESSSVGPNAGGQLRFANDNFFVGPVGADNGGNTGPIEQELANAAQALNALVSQDAFSIDAALTFGGADNPIAGAIDTFQSNGIRSGEDLVADIIRRGVIKGLTEAERDQILANDNIGTGISNVIGIRQSRQPFIDAVRQQLLGFTDPRGAALAELERANEARREEARLLGIFDEVVDDLARIEAIELDQVMARFADSAVAAAQDFTGARATIDDYLVELTASGNSFLSPELANRNAQAAFSALVAQAQAGGQDAIAEMASEITASARRVLETSRTLNASSPAFQDTFDRTVSVLTGLSAQLGAGGGIDRLAAAQTDQTALIDELVRANRAQTATIERMAAELADRNDRAA